MGGEHDDAGSGVAGNVAELERLVAALPAVADAFAR
jgi:hypothetical protein